MDNQQIQVYSAALEIGYGSGSLLGALAPYATRAQVGIEKSVNADAYKKLKANHPQLFLFGMDQKSSDLHSLKQAEMKGPYSVVYGTDIFRSDTMTDLAGSSEKRVEYLKQVFISLENGGVLMILNSLVDPIFTKDELTAAGFTIELYNSQRFFTPGELKELKKSNHPHLPMYFSMVRKGTFDTSVFDVKTLSSKP